MMMSPRTRNQSGAQAGFTLVELLVVIAILGLLASVATIAVVKFIDDGRVAAAKMQITQFKGAIQKYYIDVGQYPQSDQGLRALLERPSDEKLARGWKGPYLEIDEIPLDPWNNEYIFVLNESTDGIPFEIISLGKDGVQGGEGYSADISSRKLEN